jgi:hypothetical protein
MRPMSGDSSVAWEFEATSIDEPPIVVAVYANAVPANETDIANSPAAHMDHALFETFIVSLQLACRDRHDRRLSQAENDAQVTIL